MPHGRWEGFNNVVCQACDERGNGGVPCSDVTGHGVCYYRRATALSRMGQTTSYDSLLPESERRIIKHCSTDGYV